MTAAVGADEHQVLSPRGVALLSVRGYAHVRAVPPEQHDDTLRRLTTLCDALYDDAVLCAVCRVCFGPLVRLRTYLLDDTALDGADTPADLALAYARALQVRYDAASDTVHMPIEHQPTDQERYARYCAQYRARCEAARGDKDDYDDALLVSRALRLADACPLPRNTTRPQMRDMAVAAVHAARALLATNDVAAHTLVERAMDMRLCV